MVETKVIPPREIEVDKSSALYKLPIALLGAGIALLIFWAALLSPNQGRALYGYLFGYVSVLSVALGCLAFVLIQHLTRAGWSVVVRRVPETLIYLMPLFIVFFVPIAWFAHDIFPWTHADLDDILREKVGYLNLEFFLIRAGVYLVLWAIMGIWFYRISIAQDIDKNFERTRILQAVSAPSIIAFGLTLTFAAFDWIMSLEPHWYSTIFGVYFFAGCMLAGLSFITLVSLLLQRAGYLTTAVTGEHYHDLGKLLFGFTIFWAYIAFSQFMLYWYAGIPEEIEFYTHRLHHGWEYISWAMPITHFFIPFFALMSRALKRVKLVLACNSALVLLVHLVDLYWLIIPAYGEGEESPVHLGVEAIDVLPLFGMSAILFGCFLLALSRRKLLPIGDPRLSESLAFENF